MAKYFYVTFQGRNNPKEAKEDKFGNIEEDHTEMLKSLSFITGSLIIPSEHFIPNYFMDVIKKETKCEIVSIMSSIEMSEKDIKDLVVKSGGKPIDERPMAVPAQATKPKDEVKQSEFVIKALKSGNWRTPPTEFLSEDQDHASSGDINASAAIIKRTLALP